MYKPPELNGGKLTKMQRRYWKDPEKHREINRAYMRVHREKYNARARDERATHPYVYLLRKAKCRAKAIGVPFDLTKEWAVMRWTGHCELTGAPFVTGIGKNHAFSASLDRIDPAKGYVQGNCRFILWAINRFKGDETDETVLQVARLLLRGSV